MSISRRQFFKCLARPLDRADETAHVAEPEDFGSLAGDLPPELLAEEARRLGLCPDSTDRRAILRAMSRALERGPTTDDKQ